MVTRHSWIRLASVLGLALICFPAASATDTAAPLTFELMVSGCAQAFIGFNKGVDRHAPILD
jgi:hypothetical protein